MFKPLHPKSKPIYFHCDIADASITREAAVQSLLLPEQKSLSTLSAACMSGNIAQSVFCVLLFARLLSLSSSLCLPVHASSIIPRFNVCPGFSVAG